MNYRDFLLKKFKAKDEELVEMAKGGFEDSE
jgi:hypothetical protein